MCERTFGGAVSNSLDAGAGFHWIPGQIQQTLASAALAGQQLKCRIYGRRFPADAVARSVKLRIDEDAAPGSSELEVGYFDDSLGQFLMMFGVLR